MKRTLWLAPALLLVLVLVGVGVGLARPGWVPEWARWDPKTRAGGGAVANPRSAEAGLFCKEHGVPEAFCTLCHEELTKTLLLCKEHGNIPEDICTLCHPEVQSRYQIAMCPKGHGLPEHFCVECGKNNPGAAVLPDDGWCSTHNQPEAGCDLCARDPGLHDDGTSGRAPTIKPCRQPLPVVRLASVKMARQIGLATAPVVEETHAHRLSANAETAYDANRYAEISPRVSGFLREIRVDLGREVAAGGVVAVVDSAEVGAAKAQLLTSHAAAKLAQVAYDRTRSLTQAGAIASKMELEALTALNQAQAGAMDAEQRLRNLRFDDEAMAAILKAKDTKNLLDVVAPIAGSVVLRHAVQGEAVQPTSQLFAVADTSRMWLWIDVYESDIAKVAPGQSVSFTISGTDPAPSGEPAAFAGTVTWVGTEVNPTTRTTRVRAELANPQGRLRANQFGHAEIRVGTEHVALVVPRAAVQRKDRTDVVFLPQADGTYRPQRVVTRPIDHGDVVEVAWGLKAGQRVVTTGAFLLKTEIMKGAIGAGCCQ
jgi:cobalt-zinc-cadmium efflux system membrane fusion protein